MKFQAPLKTFRDAIARLSIIPGALPASPYTQAIRFEAGMGGLTLSRFTAIAKISLTLEEVEIEEDEGVFYVDHGSLTKLLSRLVDKSISFSSDKLSVHYVSGTLKGKMLLLPDVQEEAPEQDEGASEVKVMGDNLAEMLRYALLSSSRDTAGRGDLCGVCLREMSGFLSFIGTSGRTCHVQVSDVNLDVDCTIPNVGVESILKALGSEDGVCSLSVGEKMVSVVASTVEVSVILMESKFPNIMPILEKDASSIESKIKIDKVELSEALRQCSSVASGDAMLVNWEAGKKSLLISGADGVLDMAATVKCEATDKAKVGIPSKQLLTSLDAMGAEADGSIEIVLYVGNYLIRQKNKIAFAALSKPL